MGVIHKKPMPERVLVVFTTLPDLASAESMASSLVEKKLAACVNIQGRMTSVYSWKGKIANDKEHQLVIKTTAARYPAVENHIKQQHPYELPEILALPVSAGLSGYIEWVDSCTKD